MAKPSILPWLAIGAAGWLALRSTASIAPNILTTSSAAPPAEPLPLRAGVPYLFLVRVETTDETARALLESKGVENIEFSPAENPPPWTNPGETYSTRVVSFKAVPRGNGTVTVGDPFYGIGRLDTLVRLDGMPLEALALEA